MSLECAHGSLARSCDICQKDLEIDNLEERVRYYRNEWESACERESFLIARVAELQLIEDDRESLAERGEVLHERIEQLAAVLEWYADHDNYGDDWDPGHHSDDGTDWIWDQGDRARAALSEKEAT